jgi:hypothetical protein
MGPALIPCVAWVKMKFKKKGGNKNRDKIHRRGDRENGENRENLEKVVHHKKNSIKPKRSLEQSRNSINFGKLVFRVFFFFFNVCYE